MTGAWKLALAAGPKFVLLSLCDNANDQGQCFPSISMIAQRCSMGERTVQAHIQSLVDAGLLQRIERTGRSTIYQLDPRKICTPADFAPPQNPHPTPAKSAPPPPQISHPTPADFAPITVKEPSIEPSRKQGARSAPKRPDDVPEQVWTDWLALRKQKRASVTETVLSEARSEAGKAGISLERFLRIWCARGSQGLQADWLKPHERGSPAVWDEARAKTIAALRGENRAPAKPAQEVFDVIATRVD